MIPERVQHLVGGRIEVEAADRAIDPARLGPLVCTPAELLWVHPGSAGA